MAMLTGVGAFGTQYYIMGKLNHFNYYHYELDKFLFVESCSAEDQMEPGLGQLHKCSWL